MKALKSESRSLSAAFFSLAGVYAFGVPLTMLAQILLARLISVEEFGAFGFSLSVATVVSIPIVAGIPMLLVREVPAYIAAADVAKYKGLVRRAHLWIFSTSVALLTIFVVFSLFWFPSIDANSATQFVIVSLLVLIFSLNSVRSGVMKGLGHASFSESPTQVLQPLLLIAGFLGINAVGRLSLLSALFWYVISNLIAFLAAYVILLRIQPRDTRRTNPDYTDQPRWARAMLPFAAMSLVWSLSAQVAVLLLGILSDNEAVAAMRVAERGAMLISFPLMFVNAVIGPHIVQQYRVDDNEKLQRTLQAAARLAAFVALPIALILIIAGRSLISLTFGEEYSTIAYPPMIVLVIGHTISIMFGPAGILLVMTGLEKLNLGIQIIALSFFLVSTIALISEFGASGAAAGAAIHIVLASALSYWAALKRRGLRTSIV